ncbi:hypothetical protein J2O02_18230 (plasmid) [Elizabethkingia anophelis]|uniref:hypothetical protein n=1 Tax=Elizabethkingia anophelis TaxID=1117645 RepID=UPI0020B8E798|nr:hypothetical protein [Elizabethkingia anophelis]UTG66804.1 hypothetical protein J2O02_18230 [Elizabethkingia anophelis]
MNEITLYLFVFIVLVYSYLIYRQWFTQPFTDYLKGTLYIVISVFLSTLVWIILSKIPLFQTNYGYFLKLAASNIVWIIIFKMSKNARIRYITMYKEVLEDILDFRNLERIIPRESSTEKKFSLIDDIVGGRVWVSKEEKDSAIRINERKLFKRIE